VDAPVSVATGLNGNVPVDVILLVKSSSTRFPENESTDRPRGSLTSTGAFPFTRAATLNGSLQVHGYVHAG
jgi:hypothetical protein